MRGYWNERAVALVGMAIRSTKRAGSSRTWSSVSARRERVDRGQPFLGDLGGEADVERDAEGPRDLFGEEPPSVRCWGSTRRSSSDAYHPNVTEWYP